MPGCVVASTVGARQNAFDVLVKTEVCKAVILGLFMHKQDDLFVYVQTRATAAVLDFSACHFGGKNAC